MKVLLFGGFLGAGKTSSILSAAKFLVENNPTAQASNPETPSLVIIENEVGETGIDDKILKAEGLMVRELFSGCICCTLTSELTVTLNELYEAYDPQWVIVEATGMAYPHRIAETIHTYGKGVESLKNIIVADAERWEELTEIVPGLVEGQIAKADLIFLNKIDCMQPETLSEIEKNLHHLNPSAQIYCVSAFRGINSEIWSEAVLGNE
ncbi:MULTISPECIES: GTP-binding protein [Desulfitobacterium]|uniref:Putative GTPase, G3E family n=1 Tax=Desulfitobacterium dehalogenans (strain ATCC 51507 / DSM 9161 / JW/IU-DC1) TaxID=756499 RepID=I4A904_DESDJ|nr:MULTISPECIES: GTP-binding protein [Desulfitobacterium]AFM00439.1 putative GTPase, G3E family [Desulfitobacterium dehalogenans ATCC 51507]